MFYNVENLFDCRHDTLKNDKEFLPTSMRAWGYGRYKTKIHNIAKVITAVGGWTPPILVGMCEVENSKVMDDLVKYSSFKEHGYRYVMTDSPDERGIDVALLYQRSSFKLLNHRSIRVNFKDKERRPTRDILHVSGLIMNSDTLDVFVCHLPSRAGGESVSEPARLFVASVIKRATDSLFCIRSHPNLIVMGDFNDYPHNASLSKVLQVGVPTGTVCSCKLYNLLADKEANHSIGSYKYQGEWGILDQLIVSGFLLNNSSGLHTSVDKARICNFPFLLERDDKSLGLRPFRTYYGMKYQGGFSDHLPVCVDFELRD
ncbi:MAG: endonuclease [Bacteroides sp.]